LKLVCSKTHPACVGISSQTFWPSSIYHFLRQGWKLF